MQADTYSTYNENNQNNEIREISNDLVSNYVSYEELNYVSYMVEQTASSLEESGHDSHCFLINCCADRFAVLLELLKLLHFA